ncbi:MerR family transcriptional regulator [Agromyces humatus]|uniref:HTH merR-type domain-containing protein n=1 Tax=Agromyces humatus TaxID=279573 RepID=A0ABP4WCH3_9MICO|nr:MerR family transcriptional regulator [Agromyces humatus]
MTVEQSHPGRLTTATLARVSGYSVQQVRDLERLGVIPPARRAANGYRQFSSIHILALRAYRNLALAVGPVQARQAQRAVRELPIDPAAALISSLHVTLTRERDGVLAALRALDQISAESMADPSLAADDDAMTITELAGALGVRSSTLRFWEQQGLVTPERVTRMNARRYPLSAIREARITAALRAGGYRIPEVRGLLHSIRELDVDDPRAALHERLDTVAMRTLALLRAGTDIAALVTAERTAR